MIYNKFLINKIYTIHTILVDYTNIILLIIKLYLIMINNNKNLYVIDILIK